MDGDKLRLMDRLLIGGLILLGLGLGVITELRSAHLSRRMGDGGVFLRAAWAVRDGGAELYHVTCDNGWHYNYPPILAIAMTPLADPPRGAAPMSTVPFEWSVAIWYVVGVLALCWGIHKLAGALQPELPAWGRRWWYLRVAPAILVSVAIGTTLTKGQVNTVVLGAMCAWLAETLRGRGIRAGLYLAAAMAIKIVPAFLLVMPVVRRDFRCLAGVALGLLLSMVVIPTAVFGPSRTVTLGQEYVRFVLAPGLGIGDDQSRSKELTSTTGTDSQAFSAVIHNTIHRDPLTRPVNASRDVKLIHMLLGGLATMATLLVFRQRGSVVQEALFGGSLMVLMIFVSPASHLHYYVFAVPLLMAAFVVVRGPNVFPSARVQTWFAACGLAIALVSLPGFLMLRDLCLAVYGGVGLWATGLVLNQRLAKELSLPAEPPSMPWKQAA